MNLIATFVLSSILVFSALLMYAAVMLNHRNSAYVRSAIDQNLAIERISRVTISYDVEPKTR